MNAFEKEAQEKWGQTQAYKEYEQKHRSKQTSVFKITSIGTLPAPPTLSVKRSPRIAASKA